MVTVINVIQEPCKIIYLSACHNPEQVEEDPWTAWAVNVEGPNYLLEKIKRKITFVYASTDAVYGESSNGYRYKEDDTPKPVSLYGIQKMAGEAVTTHYGGHSFRFTLLTGPSMIKGRKHFHDIILERLKDGPVLELFSDVYRCMLDFGSAAEIMVRLLEKHAEDIPPILNISGDEPLSKYDIGIRLARKYKLPDNNIIPVSLSEDSKIFRTKRAGTILTDNLMLKRLLCTEKIQLSL